MASRRSLYILRVPVNRDSLCPATTATTKSRPSGWSTRRTASTSSARTAGTRMAWRSARSRLRLQASMGSSSCAARTAVQAAVGSSRTHGGRGRPRSMARHRVREYGVEVLHQVRGGWRAGDAEESSGCWSEDVGGWPGRNFGHIGKRNLQGGVIMSDGLENMTLEQLGKRFDN